MMRRHYLIWSIAVLGIVGTVYGAYSIIYHNTRGNDIPVFAWILLVLGIVCLTFFITWAVSVYIAKMKKAKHSSPSDGGKKEEVVAPTESQKDEGIIDKTETKSEVPPNQATYQEDIPPVRRTYSYSSSSSFSTAYVKLIGYGPLLRVEGNSIWDMRSNTYYRIENNVVMQDGYGIRYEIVGNQIKDAFGGYLFEYDGSNINKVYGGFFASVSGNYITLYDGSQKYELTESLSKKQMLAVAALLFGNR